jgi:hypothetical protein
MVQLRGSLLYPRHRHGQSPGQRLRLYMIEAESDHSVRNRKRPKNERLRATIQ